MCYLTVNALVVMYPTMTLKGLNVVSRQTYNMGRPVFALIQTMERRGFYALTIGNKAINTGDLYGGCAGGKRNRKSWTVHWN